MKSIKELEAVLKENRNTYYKRHIDLKELWKTQLQALKDVLELLKKRAEDLSKVPDDDFENKHIANLKLEEVEDWIKGIIG